MNLRRGMLVISLSVLPNGICQGLAARGLSHEIVMLDSAVVDEEIDWVHVRKSVLVQCKTETDRTQQEEQYLDCNVSAE